MTERNETQTEQMTQSAAPCSEPNCIDMALAVLRSHPAATWRDEFSGLATDDLVIDRDMARHFADEASTLRAENERLRSTVATLTAENEQLRLTFADTLKVVAAGGLLHVTLFDHAVEQGTRIATLTDQLREARADERELLDSRERALAELATLREQADTIPPPKRRAARRSN